MNDLERDLREVLHEDARHVATPASAPEGLRRSARRRQVVFVGLVGLAGAAVVAGIVAGATTLLPLQRGPEPAVPGTATTSTLNGITITYPQSWHLIDPDTAGLNGSPQMSESPLPRIVLALAPTEAPETFGCPGRANGGEAAPLLMTLQEEPIALSGQDATAQGVQNIISGWQTMTVWKDQRAGAALTAAAAVALLKGQKPKQTGTVANGSKRLPAYIIAPVSITKANYKILFNGYLKRSQVCVGQYAKFCK